MNIWFGVIVTALCMIGIVTPPVGANIFVTKGLVANEVSMASIIKGVQIFLITLVTGLILLMAPVLSTFLPSFMSY